MSGEKDSGLADALISNPHMLENLKTSIDMNALLPHLISKGLVELTADDSFSNIKFTNKERVDHLISIIFKESSSCIHNNLLILIQCLEAEDSHPKHRQFVEFLRKGRVSHNDTYPNPLHARKRKKIDEEVVTVPKRHLLPIKPHGSLSTSKYCIIMAKIQEHHYYTEWEKADKLVEECKTKYDTEFYLAAKLRNYSCHVTNKHMFEKIRVDIKEILKWCSKNCSDNSKIIESKCYWVLAKGCRYKMDMDTADKYITAAMQFQHAFEPGEDIACSSYCKASILNHTLAKRDNLELFMKVKQLYQKAIDNVRHDEFRYGLPVCHPVIRLAQMCLYCTPHKAGICKDKKQIKEAENLLGNIKTNRLLLKPRITTLYYIAMSDLFRNKCDVEKAEDYIRRAENISHEHRFVAEIDTVLTRLAALGLSQNFP